MSHSRQKQTNQPQFQKSLISRTLFPSHSLFTQISVSLALYIVYIGHKCLCRIYKYLCQIIKCRCMCLWGLRKHSVWPLPSIVFTLSPQLTFLDKTRRVIVADEVSLRSPHLLLPHLASPHAGQAQPGQRRQHCQSSHHLSRISLSQVNSNSSRVVFAAWPPN